MCDEAKIEIEALSYSPAPTHTAEDLRLAHRISIGEL